MSDKPRLQVKYEEDVMAALKEKLGLKSVMQVPKLEKICLSMGIRDAQENAAVLDQAVEHLTQIAGQKAVVTKARRAVSAFGIRLGYKVGCRVTLRRTKMYEFLDRLITVAIPRIRDFRGLSPKGFDSWGNYAFGIDEQTVFPEIRPDSVTSPQGLNIVFTTTAKTDDEGRALMEAFDFPFQKSGN